MKAKMEIDESSNDFRVVNKGLIANNVQVELNKWNISLPTLTNLLASKDTKFISINKFCKMSNSESTHSKDQALIGTVINTKKFSSQGKETIMWELYDLKEFKIKIMVNYDPTNDNDLLETGILWAVLNPKLRENDPQYDIRLADVKDSANLMKIGTVNGLIHCKGITNKGSSCRNIVYSVLQGDYCKYHVHQATKKKRSNDFNSEQSANSKNNTTKKSKLQEVTTKYLTPPSIENKILKKSIINSSPTVKIPQYPTTSINSKHSKEQKSIYNSNLEQNSQFSNNNSISNNSSILPKNKLTKLDGLIASDKSIYLKTLIERAERSRPKDTTNNLSVSNSSDFINKNLFSDKSDNNYKNLVKKNYEFDKTESEKLVNYSSSFLQQQKFNSITTSKNLSSLIKTNQTNDKHFINSKDNPKNTSNENSINSISHNDFENRFIAWTLRLSLLQNSKDAVDFNTLKDELNKYKTFKSHPYTEKMRTMRLDSLCENLFLHPDEEISIASLKCYRWLKSNFDNIQKLKSFQKTFSVKTSHNSKTENNFSSTISNKLQLKANLCDTISPNNSAGTDKLSKMNYNLNSNSNNKDIFNDRKSLLKEIENAIGKKSTIDDYREQEDISKLKENMDNLIKLDATEEFKSTITFVEIEAWFCTLCNMWMDKINPNCQNNNHKLKRGSCKKEFWECLTPLCQQRFFSLNKQKPELCPKCKHSTAFAKSVSMYTPRKTFLLESEKLLISTEDFIQGS